MDVRTKPENAKIRVFVADSSRIHTQLLAHALESEESFEIFPHSASPENILAEVLQNTPDVAIISSVIAGDAARGFDLVRDMRAASPGLRVVMLLDSPVREMVLEAFRCGARGIFSRNESLESLRGCILRVHQGEICARAEQISYAVEALASAPVMRAVNANGFRILTKREIEVVQYLAEGLTNREIAKRMGLSQHTIKNYLFKIFDKVGATSRVELLFMTLSQTEVPLQQRASADSEHQISNPNNSALHLKAAEDGLPSAQFRLAHMYTEGLGVPKDLVAAYTWYSVCEDRTTALNQEALKKKQIISTHLSPEQLAEAQRKAKLYFQKWAKGIAANLKNGATQLVACIVCILLLEIMQIA